MSEKKYLITISRQFASMGRTIARALSQELGIDFLDRDIVEETAKRMNLPISKISDSEESSRKRLFSLEAFGLSPQPLEDEIFEVQRNIILDYANKQSGIIVGRCAESILRDYENKLSVRLYASFEDRLDNCINKLQMEPKTAPKVIKKADESRELYRKRYCRDIDTAYAYHDIMINTGTFGVEGTVKLIAGIARERFM